LFDVCVYSDVSFHLNKQSITTIQQVIDVGVEVARIEWGDVFGRGSSNSCCATCMRLSTCTSDLGKECCLRLLVMLRRLPHGLEGLRRLWRLKCW
jgi:hypothetical protein